MSEKIEIPYDALLKETLGNLRTDGLLLVTQGKDGKPNAMAIGWGAMGTVWGEPMFVVLVRPSRHTYDVLAENSDFTVNVMPDEMVDVVTYCGTVSGRDEDKFAEKGLTAIPGIKVNAPIIEQSRVAYECRTVMSNDVLPERLERSIQDSAYPSGDYHRIYFGKILCARADADLVSGSGS